VSQLVLLALQVYAARPQTERWVLALRRNALCQCRTSEENDALDSVPKDPELVIEEA